MPLGMMMADVHFADTPYDIRHLHARLVTAITREAAAPPSPPERMPMTVVERPRTRLRRLARPFPEPRRDDGRARNTAKVVLDARPRLLAQSLQRHGKRRRRSIRYGSRFAA